MVKAREAGHGESAGGQASIPRRLRRSELQVAPSWALAVAKLSASWGELLITARWMEVVRPTWQRVGVERMSGDVRRWVCLGAGRAPGPSHSFQSCWENQEGVTSGTQGAPACLDFCGGESWGWKAW